MLHLHPTRGKRPRVLAPLDALLLREVPVPPQAILLKLPRKPLFAGEQIPNLRGILAPNLESCSNDVVNDFWQKISIPAVIDSLGQKCICDGPYTFDLTF